MELRFVIASLRRLWWIPLLSAIGGVLAASLLAGPPRRQFQSTAVIAIESPGGEVSSDREVAQQIAVLRSRSFTDRVAGRASVDPAVAASAIKVSQQPATDLVDIVATAADPERAQRIAQATAQEYIASQRRNVQERSQGGLSALNERAGAIEAELKRLAQLPPAEASTPDNIVLRSRKEQEYRGVLDARAALQLESEQAVSEVVEPGRPARLVPQTGRRLMMAAGLLSGAALGFALATALGRFSRYVVDDVHAGEILGLPVIAKLTLPAAQVYRGPQPPRWSPREWEQLDVITAQLQSIVALDAPLRIAVVAAQRGAGATAVSLALAGSLTRTGEPVVLLDADGRNPELSDICIPNGSSPAAAPAPRTAPLVSKPSPGPAGGASGPVILSRGHSGLLRREAVPALLAQAVGVSRLVVADGGPLVDSAAAAELCHSADAVVLVLRHRKQQVDVLRTTAMRLNGMSAKVLAVSVSLRQPSRRQRRRAADADGRHGSQKAVVLHEAAPGTS